MTVRERQQAVPEPGLEPTELPAPTRSSPERDVRIRLEGRFEAVERTIGALRRARRIARRKTPTGLVAAVWETVSGEAAEAEAHLARHADEAVVVRLLRRLREERRELLAAFARRLARAGQTPGDRPLPEQAAAIEGEEHVLYRQVDYGALGRALMATFGAEIAITVAMEGGLTPRGIALSCAAAYVGAWLVLRAIGFPPALSRVLVTSKRIIIDGVEHQLGDVRHASASSASPTGACKLFLEFPDKKVDLDVKYLPFGARLALRALGPGK